jgi:hypothetical protein
MSNYYTYAYLREDGTPYYIGKGKDRRAYQSHRHISKPKDKDIILFLKQNLTEDEAFKHEKYMINVLGRKDLGTGILINLTEGGEGTSGSVRSEETKEKIGNSNRGENSWWYGKIHSDETRKIMSEAKRGEKHPYYGKTLTEEHKRKLSESRMGKLNPNYGKTHTEEIRRKMSESLKGRTLSEEHKRKLSEARKGKNHSEESKRKMSDAHKGKSHSIETKKKMSEVHRLKFYE